MIEAAHDEAWEVLVQYRDVLDALVLQLMEHETLARTQVMEIFAPVQKRPSRGSYTGYGKRMPSDRPPVLTPKELALTAASDGKDLPRGGNGQAPGIGNGYGDPMTKPFGFDPRLDGLEDPFGSDSPGQGSGDDGPLGPRS